MSWAWFPPDVAMNERAPFNAREAMKENLRVKNLSVSGPIACMFPNWLEHWRTFSRLPLPVHCPESVCREKPEVGVLVQKNESADAGWYVIPLCRKHSLASVPLEVFTLLIPATYADAVLG